MKPGAKTRRTKKNPQAVAVFRNNGNGVEGTLVGTQVSPTRVQLRVEFTHLPPGKHGFHIHKAGDLRGEGCHGACEHFHVGPAANHGGPHDAEKHTGDLGNVEMPRGGGPLRFTHTLKGVRVEDLWGRSAIVHADEDDLGRGNHPDSATTGHSGARIACAIFGRTC